MVVSYRQSLALGWAILKRVFWGSIFLTPLVFISRLAPAGSARASALEATAFSLMIALELFVVLPLSIEGAIPGMYSDFRLSVAGRAHGGERLSYFESLQVSLLAFAIHAGSTWLCYCVQKRLGSVLFGLIQLPFWAPVVYPAIAAAVVRVPFKGFRVFMVHHARSPAVPDCS
jgi:hypothetical protein